MPIDAPTPPPLDLPEALGHGGRYAEWDPDRPVYVLCDVDGTLVGSSGAVSDAVRDAAVRAVEAGLYIGFATGRGAVGLRELEEAVHLPGPHVVANGGQVIHRGRPAVTHAVAADVIAAVRDYGVYAELYTGDGYWVTEWREEARPHWELLGTEPVGVLGRDGDPDLAEVAKITAVTFGQEDDHDEAGLRAALEGCDAEVGAGTSPGTPGFEYLNVTARGADKGSALRAAADVLGIPVSSTVVVGDERNDLSMFAVAGTAIAMGQAEPEILAAAHLVCPAVADDGLAAVLDAVRSWQEPAG